MNQPSSITQMAKLLETELAGLKQDTKILKDTVDLQWPNIEQLQEESQATQGKFETLVQAIVYLYDMKKGLDERTKSLEGRFDTLMDLLIQYTEAVNTRFELLQGSIDGKADQLSQ